MLLACTAMPCRLAELPARTRPKESVQSAPLDGCRWAIRGERGQQTLGCVQVIVRGRIRDQGANL